jgi:hypothetical protein
MEYKTILIVLVLGAAIFSGCVDNPSKTVYFANETNQTMTLYSDKTFTYTADGNTYSGVYRVDGNHVILTFHAFGAVLDLEKKDNKLISKKGTVWERV